VYEKAMESAKIQKLNQYFMERKKIVAVELLGRFVLNKVLIDNQQLV
jgi:hypothetical protein